MWNGSDESTLGFYSGGFDAVPRHGSATAAGTPSDGGGPGSPRIGACEQRPPEVWPLLTSMDNNR
jgi:hypothetical protein